MDKSTFERLRSLPDKAILDDVVLRAKKDTSPVLVSDKVPVWAAGEIVGHLSIRFNPETGAKTVNASVEGVGPICRLDVDDRPHGRFGRSHKHELGSDGCPAENLKRHLLDMSEFDGLSVQEVLNRFCEMARIHHHGETRVAD